jgi:hypothetical protein
MEDPSIYVLDVGKKYEPAKGNFDHHQDPQLPATNMLVLKHMLETDKISKELYDELINYFETIGFIDINGYQAFDGFQVNALIRNFNYLPQPEGFNLALASAKGLIAACKDTVNKASYSELVFNNGKVLSDKAIKCSEFPIHWKRYGTFKFLICPHNTLEGKWCLHSIDGSRYPIKAIGEEEFIHTGKIIAVYPSEYLATKAGQEQ